MIHVVIPLHNGAKYLQLTINSLLNQTFKDWKLVICNNGSTDNSLDVARVLAGDDRRIEVFDLPCKGVAKARNAGFKYVGAAKFVLFLDQDDELEPIFLSELLRVLEEHPLAVAAHCYPVVIDSKSEVNITHGMSRAMQCRFRMAGDAIVRGDEMENTAFSHLAVNNAIISPGATLIRSSAFVEVGGFDEELQFVDDWDLWVRLSRHSDIIYVNQPLFRYRMHDSNTSSDHSLAAYFGQKIRFKILKSRHNSPEQSIYAQKAYRAFYAFLGRERFCSALKSLKNMNFGSALRSLTLSAANYALALNGGPPRLYLRR